MGRYSKTERSQMNKIFIIKADCPDDRKAVFDPVLDIVRKVFKTLVSASYSRGESMMGIWDMRFIVDETEHIERKEKELFKALGDFYKRNPRLANGYKIIWDGDSAMRTVWDSLNSLARFGSSSHESFGMNLQRNMTLAQQDVPENVEQLVNNLIYGISDYGQMRCYFCMSPINHLGFTSEDAGMGIKLSLIDKNEKAYESYMRTIGGKCKKCGTITCSICYLESHSCRMCQIKIPSFHGEAPE